MIIDILTLFPEMFSSLNCSILKRARENNKIEINIINIRDFSTDAHKKCDDYPYGGGAGMVMMAQPIFDAYKSVVDKNAKVIYTSPKGKVFNQKMAESFAKNEHLIILCGHYEGVDERVLELINAEDVSIGDYVLTGGELASMVITDAVSRYVDGVINKDSLVEESFSKGMLEYPQYTRPETFMGKRVPDVLLSGNHKNIEEWREQQSYILTNQKRPDLVKNKYLPLTTLEIKEIRSKINNIHFTNLSLQRIKNNLNLNTNNYLSVIKKNILNKKSLFYKKGKNYYCKSSNMIITINANSYVVITAKYTK